MASRKLALDVLKEEMETKDDPTAYWINAVEFKRLYPNLHDLLYRREWHGEQRDPGRLTLFWNDGHLKVGIFAEAEARMAFLTLEDPYDVFAHIERKLASGGLEWREDKRAKTRSRPR